MTPIFAIILQAAAGRPNILPFVIQFIAIIAIFWFLLIRPQRQQQQKHLQVLAALKKGDEIITDGGIVGQVVHIADERVTIRTAENTRIVVVRGKIAKVVEPQTAEPQS